MEKVRVGNDSGIFWSYFLVSIGCVWEFINHYNMYTASVQCFIQFSVTIVTKNQ